MQFLSRLIQTEKRFEELTQQLADPGVMNDGDQYRKASKAYADLADVVAKFREWKKAERELEQARARANTSHPEMREIANEEIARLQPLLASIEDELKVLLLPK